MLKLQLKEKRRVLVREAIGKRRTRMEGEDKGRRQKV